MNNFVCFSNSLARLLVSLSFVDHVFVLCLLANLGFSLGSCEEEFS